MSDTETGNANGTVVDGPVPNSEVVGVDIVSGAGNEPSPEPEPEPEPPAPEPEPEPEPVPE